ncbi:ATPase family AAA domain-containing protein 5 [Frankliniella fusca]|uniref:ATPase family AAA domain-containing protein 5 n=1 Tax=Frankliniella fusca TaxID=407009 RepID=A0AAE1H621_9NEOP|nr:ATPase family AAA domain-containing protein 5 [Frankliniella fusca]
MKSMIHDYFVQGPKGNKSDVVQSTMTPNKINGTQDLGETSKTIAEEIVLNGKVNEASKGKGSKTPLRKCKSVTGNGSVRGGRRAKKKVPDSTKHLLKEDNLEQQNVLNSAKTSDEVASPKSFPFKIRIKSKEQTDNDNFIEDFDLPQHAAILPDSDSKELKSPQGTMLKYLVQEHSSVSSKDSASLSKVKVNISDFFSPAKEENCATDKINGSCLKSDDEKEKPSLGVDKNVNVTPPITVKSVKKQAKKSLTISKNRKTIERTSPAQDDSSMRVVAMDHDVKSTSKGKLRSSRKSLTLPKNGVNPGHSKPEDSAQAQLEGKECNELTVSQNLTDAFKKIMAKANQVNQVDALQDSASKKRKRGLDDDPNVESKPMKSVREDSPVRTVRRCSKNNQISCDSDDDTSSANFKQSKNSSFKSVSLKGKETDIAAEGSVRVDESKRNSLMSYFSKVSKEEILSKEEKIEMKVKALIHSPPTTPSKKVKRRSVNSLPGGAASLCKKKPNLKNRLKESINAIEVIDLEDVKVSDSGNKKDRTSKENGEKQSSPTSLNPKDTTQNTTSDHKLVPSLLADISSEKLGASPRSNKKKTLSKGKLKRSTISRSSFSSGIIKTLDKDEESLATPLENFSEEESDNDEIFSSRQDKKRKIEKELEKKTAKADDFNSSSKRTSSPDIIFEKETVSDAKIAPLFTRKADSQARQLFLQSGVPEQVKRTIETQRSFEEQEVEIFPKESHVQQKTEKWFWSLPPVSIPLISIVEEIPLPSCKFSIRDFNGGYDILDEIDYIISASCKGPGMRTIFGLPTDVIRPILRIIKQDSKNMMVVNTFKALRKKYKEDDFLKAAALSALADVQKPKRKSSNRKSSNAKENTGLPVFRALLWTEKYKPSTASEIVGNHQSVQQLKRWLEAWRKASEDCGNLAKLSSKDDVKRKKKKKDLLDDDFLVSDNSSDGGNINLPPGVAVLYGPNGNGKTSTVYALAKDLGFKVLEVNASEKRNGKLVLSKLSEATQSHQVQQSKTAEQGFAALFGKKQNSVKSKKSNEALKISTEVEEEKGKKMSLILFEDVDIVFEDEDEGFLSAITNLVSTSKRPVILTTTDPDSPMISRFMNSSSLILHFSCPPNLMSSWLQIVSVVEGIYAAPDTIQDLVSLCKGDFRRALLQMQLWIMSGASNLLMPSLPSLHSRTKKNSKHDDNDDISETDEDGSIVCPPPIPANTDCIATLLGRNFDSKANEEKADKLLEVPYPLDLGLFWWNLPPILSFRQIQHAKLPEKCQEDRPVSGQRQMLDDSFIASFCTDDGSTTDCSNTNDDSDVTCSQATSVEESVELQDNRQAPCTDDLSSVKSNSYKQCCSPQEMKTFWSQMFVVSSIDVIAVSCHLQLNASCLEPISRFSHPVLKDSLSLVKEEVEGPNYVLNTTAEDICHWLAEQSLNNTRISLGLEKCDSSMAYNNCLPSQEEHRWRDAHSDTEQGALLAVPLCMRLERRAIASDYLPALRIFCRLERNRSTINTKRRNRFYHYLRSLGAVLSEQQLEILCCTMCDS